MTKEKIFPYFNYNPLFELLAIFALIMIYIWRLRDGVSWIPILMLIISTHFMRGDTLRKVGFCPKDFKKCFRDFGGQVFIGFIGGLSYAGFLCVLFLGWPVREMTIGHALANLADDTWSGFFQQYLLNGYFLNRFVGFFGDEKHPLAPWLAAVFFFRGPFSQRFFDAGNFMERIFCFPDIFEKRRKSKLVFSGAGSRADKIFAFSADAGSDQPWIQNRPEHFLILSRVNQRLFFAAVSDREVLRYDYI